MEPARRCRRQQLHGKELSFNNLVDLDACWELVQEFDRPAVAIIKHTNPCGAASAPPSSRPTKSARRRSRLGFRRSHRRQSRSGCAKPPKRSPSCSSKPSPPRVHSRSPRALAAKKNLRLIELPCPAKPVIKQVSGGLLLQDADTAPHRRNPTRSRHLRATHRRELESLLFAWRVCKHVKSNAIVYARDGQTLGVGAGQMSRVDAAKFGAMKAVLRSRTASPPLTPSSPSPMVWRQSPLPAQPPSFSPVARSATRT